MMNLLEKSEAVSFHFCDVSEVDVVHLYFSITEHLVDHHTVEPHVSWGHTAHLTRPHIGVRQPVSLRHIWVGVTAPGNRNWA